MNLAAKHINPRYSVNRTEFVEPRFYCVETTRLVSPGNLPAAGDEPAAGLSMQITLNQLLNLCDIFQHMCLNGKPNLRGSTEQVCPRH